MEKFHCWNCDKEIESSDKYWILIDNKGVVTEKSKYTRRYIKSKRGTILSFCSPKCLLEYLYEEDFSKILEDLNKEKSITNKFDLYFKKLKNTTKSTIVKTLKKVEETIEKTAH